MENNITTLELLKSNILKKRLESKRALSIPSKNHWRFLQLSILNTHSELLFSYFLNMIKEVEENEKEQSKNDWKEGYLKAVSDVSEFFGVNDKELDLTEIEMKVIDNDAMKYAENKFSKR